MSRRELAHQAEGMVLARIRQHTTARSAHEIATEMGWPWRVVARTLQRLITQGEVQQVVCEFRGPRSRPRRVTRYKAARAALPELPTWLTGDVHPVCGARLVKGRASMLR